MYKFLILTLLSVIAYSQNNSTKIDTNSTKDLNSTKKTVSKKTKLEKNIEKAIAKEKKFKKEQKFYQGKDYNLTDKKIDSSSLDNIKVIKPDYDFEMLEF